MDNKEKSTMNVEALKARMKEYFDTHTPEQIYEWFEKNQRPDTDRKDYGEGMDPE